MMSNQARYKIFISHIKEEEEFAKVVKQCLDAAFGQSVEVFVAADPEGIKEGADWLKAISDSLETADLMLVLCSKTSVSRPWINFESGAAWVRRIPLIPLCHSYMEPHSLPLPLNTLQAARIDNPEGVSSLIKTIKTYADKLSLNDDVNDAIKNMISNYHEIRHNIVRRALGAVPK